MSVTKQLGNWPAPEGRTVPNPTVPHAELVPLWTREAELAGLDISGVFETTSNADGITFITCEPIAGVEPFHYGGTREGHVDCVWAWKVHVPTDIAVALEAS